jgi:hypothetical protein
MLDHRQISRRASWLALYLLYMLSGMLAELPLLSMLAGLESLGRAVHARQGEKGIDSFSLLFVMNISLRFRSKCIRQRRRGVVETRFVC